MIREVVDARAAVVAALGRVRRRSLAGTLLGEARNWLTAWLDDVWFAAESESPHTHLLYRQMTAHLKRVAERLPRENHDATDW